MLKAVITRLYKLISSKALLVAVLAIIACVSIYYFGPKIKLKGFAPFKTQEIRDYTITAILAVTFIIESFYFFSFLKKLRLEKAAKKTDANTEEKEVIPEFILKLERQFERIVHLLQKNWKRRGRALGGAMYATPWYLVLGKHDSGKTAFIDNSSLPYLMEDQLLEINNDKYIEGNKAEFFRWKVSNDAVVVEAKGGLFGSDKVDNEKEEVWDRFINWLLKVRATQPLNGLIIVIDIDDFIHSSIRERDDYASNLKNKVRYLNENLGIRLPVYLIISKIDLLEGFTEFFKDATSEVREQIVGFSFPLEKNSSNYWKKEFDEQYSEFISLLNHHLVRRVGVEDSYSDNQKIYSFVRQLIGLKKILFDFMIQVFEEDRYSTFPLIRGLYFTSIYQQSVPINAISESASYRYSLPEVICSSRKGRSKPHFSSFLFNRIILPEIGIAGDSYLASKQRRWNHIRAFLYSGLLVSVMVAGWFYYFQMNRDSVRNVHAKLLGYGDVNSSKSKTPEGHLNSLNILSSALKQYQSYESHIPGFTHMGLYRGHIIAPNIDKAYKRLLSNSFLPALAEELLANSSGESTDLSKSVSNKDLENLRIVRLLTASFDEKNKKEAKLLLHHKMTSVLPWFESVWEQKFPRDKENRQAKLQQHLKYALEHVGANISPQFEKKLKTIQQQIGRISLEKRLYTHIKTEAETTLPPLNLHIVAGGGYNSVFGLSGDKHLDISIPGLFTYEGYHQFYIAAHKKLLSKAALDVWALGKRKATNSYSSEDLRKLKISVNELYFKEYKQHWLDALNALKVLSFSRSMRKAVRSLEALKNIDNPYRSILTSLRKNTTLYLVEELSKPQADKKDGDSGNKGLFSLSSDDTASLKRDIAIPLAKSFAPWNALLAEDKEKSKAYLGDIEVAFANLYDYMVDIQQQSDAGGSSYALRKVIDRLNLKSETDPLYALGRIANGMKEPLRSHLKKIVKESWLVVLELAASDLDRLWKKDVYDFYQNNINGRYPLVKTQKEVSLKDFKEFFSEEGKLQIFYAKYLKTLLEDNRREVFNPDEGVNLISPNILKAFEHAALIRKGYFASKGFNVEYSIKPTGLSSVYRSSIINIEGVAIHYDQGSSSLKDMIWPNQIEPTNRSMITMNPIGKNIKQEIRTRGGAWSWFRLLDTAETIGLNERIRDIRFKFKGGYAAYRLKVLDTVNPLTRDLFKGFTLPPSLKPRYRDIGNSYYDELEGNKRL